MSIKYKILVTLIFVSLSIFAFPSFALACTYEGTITGNHLDFSITSDIDKLAVIQYINRSGSALVTQMYSPDISSAWSYFSDPNCNVGLATPIACRQNRSGGLGGGAFWQWYSNGAYHALPGNGWELDFNSPPDFATIGIEYAVIPGTAGESWTWCSRTGDVQLPSPSPTALPTVTPTEFPTPSPTPTQTPSPTPTANPTPIPTPTPSPTPTPVTKVFLIPGMGASWNVDALINCKNSGYAGGWTLAPYAKGIYGPLSSALTSNGWNTTPFYYDWRQDIRNNASLLNDSINSNTSSSEKIDLVGHSMGGLIGRNYLESQNGGKATKLLAVGAPNQGSALAYTAVVNGEIWANDLIEKIAATLLIKHCGVPPSFQNLLPTYNYLRDNKTKQLKNVSGMLLKNNYLPTNFVSPFWGVKVGTLAGTGKATLKIIDVIKDSRWPDGKPTGKETVNEGDGTVLTQSAQISGAFSNDVINQSHSGIIASTEGINHILSFLGSPGIADPPYSESTSALILVGYPGNFWLTDQNGITTQSDQGMIALMNPKDGNYQLQIVSTSTSITFLVGQFLSNGQTSYKEYKFKGLAQEPKIIEFDSRHAQQDILHDVKDYKNPHFPKFWYEFWKFWSKLHK